MHRINGVIYLQVAWVRVDTQTILSIHHNVITQNPRISLSYNDHRSWFLHIKNVQEADRGWYMCQVNTDPMRSRQGYLQVVGKQINTSFCCCSKSLGMIFFQVPPSIIDRETSSDMVVLESTNVSLTCKATGYPEPYVMWRREDGEDIRYNGENGNCIFMKFCYDLVFAGKILPSYKLAIFKQENWIYHSLSRDFFHSDRCFFYKCINDSVSSSLDSLWIWIINREIIYYPDMSPFKIFGLQIRAAILVCFSLILLKEKSFGSK